MEGKPLALQPVTSDPLNAETLLKALAEAVTPEDLFYIRNHFDIPIINGDQYALQVNGKVTKVEISFDDDENWMDTHLDPPTSSYGYYRWKYNWRPESTGRYLITARAYDSDGQVQPLAARWNKGGYGNNKVHQITVVLQD